MIQINENYLNLEDSYLFSEISRRVREYKNTNPEADVIRLGIGDVSLPLPLSCVEAMHKAVDEMAQSATFRGYGPEQGHDFLLDAILKNDYLAHNLQMDQDEIFVSDGSKSDTGNIVDILGLDNIVAITNPVYPVYVDTNIMTGRRKENIVFLSCIADNDFVPSLPQTQVDIIYLCFPNNPTGTTITRSQLKVWVDYARENKALILFDAAYEAYITEEDVPHSIYEIEGAREVAIEFRSFSKTAGFTGIRCAYTVVPKSVMGYTKGHEKVSLNKLWNRRHSTKFNGVSYITQRAAEACYSTQGKLEVRQTIDYYLENAKILRDALKYSGMTMYGGVNSPYLWVKTPQGLSSWECFNLLLHKLHIVTTPGVGFGSNGEGYIRISALGSRNDVLKAEKRIKEQLRELL